MKSSKSKKALSFILAAGLAFSCIATSASLVDFSSVTTAQAVDDGTTSATNSSTDDLSESENAKDGTIIVVDTAKTGNRKYDLYQIFKGNLNAQGALVDISWGSAIVKTDGTADENYNLVDDLIEELKSNNLLDGETNILKDDFASLTKSVNTEGVETEYSAATVASIIAGYSNKSEEIDAFLSAVGDLIESKSNETYTIEKRTHNKGEKDGTISTGDEYVFNNVDDGYYMVSEVSDLTDTTYSRYMAKVGVGDSGTMIYTKSSGAPTIDKKIQYGTDDESTSEIREDLHEYKNVAMSEEVKFYISSKVPNMDGYNSYYFIVDDTMCKGLTLNPDSFTVTIGEESLTKFNSGSDKITDKGNKFEVDTSLNSYGVTTNVDGTTDIKITFKNFIQYRELEGEDIVITYTATVNQNIVVGNTNANTNTAKLTYSNNPNYNYSGIPGGDPDKPNPGNPEDPSDPADPTVVTPEKTVYVYTTGVDVVKVDGNGKRLSGAQFKIEKINDDEVQDMSVVEVVPSYQATSYADYASKPADKDVYYKLVSGAYTSDFYKDSTKSRYVTENVKYSKDGGIYTKDVNGTYYKKANTEDYVSIDDASSSDSYETGIIEYTLVETMVLKESKSSEQQEIIGTVSSDNGLVSFNGLTSGEYRITETVAPNGYIKLENPIYVTIKFTAPTIFAGDDAWKCTWDITVNNSGNSGNEITASTSSTGTGEIVVENLTTHTLPTTGGIGTTIFYIAGTIIVLGAGVLLITKKRMHGDEE